MPRMQQGTGPRGIPSVSPELFSPAEFMGKPLNEMTGTGTGISGAGFFPKDMPIGGSPAVTDAGIVAGLDEEMATEPEVKENKLELAKQQAMSIFDQSFEETMAVMQAQMAAGGMPMQDMDMILMDEIEVLEGQAEATVKEAMGLPQDVDLIPAEVAQSYLEKARMIVSAPPAQEQPMEMPMDMGDQAVQNMFAGSGISGVQPEEEEETDPLSIIEENRRSSIERQDVLRERERQAAETRRDDLDTKIRAGDFSEGFKTDWRKLNALKEEVKAVAEEEAMNKSYLSPGTSGGGTAFLAALKINPKRAKLAGRKAVLDYEMKIEELKQAEQQALKQSDAQMLRNVFEQTQKIKGELSDTLLSTTGAIEKQAITETGDILTKQIGDQKGTPSREDEKYYLSILNDDSKKGTVEYDRALQQMGVTEAVVEGAKKGSNEAFELWASLATGDPNDYNSEAMEVEDRKAFFRKEYASFYSWLGTEGIEEVFPDSAVFAYLYLQHGISQQMSLQQGSQQGSAFDHDAQGVPQDVIEERVEDGTYKSGDVLLLGVNTDGTLRTYTVP